MKKIEDLILRSILILAVFFGSLFAPFNLGKAVSKGQTLNDLYDQLSDLEAKKKEQDNKKKLTEAEINKNKANIEKAEQDMAKAKTDIENVNKNIERTNAEIDEIKDESAELLVLNQKSEAENIYLSYITGASTMTELIMRSDMIDMLTNYNNAKLKELELLTENNNKLKKSLDEHQKDLEKKRAEYEKLAEALGDEYAKMNEGYITIEEEIKTMKELIKYYENYGCKKDEDLMACIDGIGSNSKWLKPVSKGVITSLVGYRDAPTPTVGTNHTGIDIGIKEGTNVYPTANGVVGAIVRKSSCGGNKLYIWTVVNGKKYTYVYMHLKEILVKVGEKVTVDQVVALSGGLKYGYDKCTTGAHLHYGLAEGHHFGSAGDLALSKFNSYIINPPGYPGLGQWFYGR